MLRLVRKRGWAISCSAMILRSSSSDMRSNSPGIPAFDLIHVEALELSAQLFCPDCRTRLAVLVSPVMTQCADGRE